MKYVSISIVVICVLVLVGFWLKKTPTPATPQGEAAPVVTQPEVATPTVEQKKPTTSIKMIQGMKVETTKEGTGDAIVNGKTAVVHYTGKLENGTVFDSSKTRGTPFEFPVGAGMVIKGWDLGVLGMKVGETRILTIPADLAYGAGGVPGAIPPNATLIFEVELLGIK